MKKLVILCTLLLSTSVLAQNKNAKATLEVDGVCMMCKARIERAAVKTLGVKSAVWNMDNHQLSLVYNEKKTSLDNISENIANAGHDTKAFKAPDAAYEAVDACCKYRDPKVMEDHKGMKGKHHDEGR